MRKLLIIMAVCFTAFSMTACLGDKYDNSTNYHTITNSEKSVIVNTMAGNYSGKVTLGYASSSAIVDSAKAEWTVKTDTTIVMSYPVELLANFLDSADVAYDALASAPAQTLTFRYAIPSIVYSYVWSNYWGVADYIPVLYSDDTAKTFENLGYSFTMTYDTYYDAINNGYYNFEYYNNKCQGYVRPYALTITDAAGKTRSVNITSSVLSVFSGSK